MIVRSIIVGAKFRPPALGILSILPAGARLIARRESTNQYDANAIQVIWPTAPLANSKASVTEINDRLAGYGCSLDELESQPHWHLGYIPRERAAELAPKMDADGQSDLEGSLFFSPSGNANVQLIMQEFTTEGA